MQPSSYSAVIAQEDGSEKTETVNEATDLPIFANTKTKTSHGFRIGGVKYTVVRTYEANEFGDFIVYGANGVRQRPWCGLACMLPLLISDVCPVVTASSHACFCLSQLRCASRQTQSGVCMVVTKQCIILGVWDKKKNANHIAATCNSTCENLGKYLMGMNY